MEREEITDIKTYCVLSEGAVYRKSMLRLLETRYGVKLEWKGFDKHGPKIC